MIPGLVRNCSRTSKTTRPAARETALIASPLNRNTTAAPMIRPTRAFGVTGIGMNSRPLRSRTVAAFASAVATDVGERPEQRRRGENRRRDRDALGDGLGGVADGVEVGEDAGALLVDVAAHLGDALGVVADRAEGVHRDDDADRGEQAGAGDGDGEQRDRAPCPCPAGTRRTPRRRSAPPSRPRTRDRR